MIEINNNFKNILENLPRLTKEDIENKFSSLYEETNGLEKKLSNFSEELMASSENDGLSIELANQLKDDFNNKIKTISDLQEKYASRLGKYESIKQDSIKRKERLLSIENEIKNWNDLKQSSETKLQELNQRLKENETLLNIEEVKPETIAEKKGTYLQNIKNIEEDIAELKNKIQTKEENIKNINQKLYEINDTVLGITERKVRSQTILEGLKTKKKEIELKSLSDFKHSIDELPNFANIDPEENIEIEKIDSQIQKLKDQRERMGAVNLRADNETQELQDQIDKMMNDRKDLVQGIQKLKSSINDLNQKGSKRSN